MTVLESGEAGPRPCPRSPESLRARRSGRPSAHSERGPDRERSVV